jgi:GNAT superfamily N-acetyltransferase
MPGIQFHARSVLVWRDRLDEDSEAWIAKLVWTGARVLALEAPLTDDASGGLSPSVLHRWAADRSGVRAPVEVRTNMPLPEEWTTMRSLWQQCGITPLANSARTSGEWTHARWPSGLGERTVATASRQRLYYPVGLARATGLACCVAVAPALRNRGLGAACLAAATADAPGPVVALVESNSPSAVFFPHLGWWHDGHAYLYEHR